MSAGATNNPLPRRALLLQRQVEQVARGDADGGGYQYQRYGMDAAGGKKERECEYGERNVKGGRGEAPAP